MIYFIRAGRSGPVKIGRARDPFRRLGSMDSGSPVPLRLLALMPGDTEQERALHTRFAHLRRRGEWFRWGPELGRFLKEVSRDHPACNATLKRTRREGRIISLEFGRGYVDWFERLARHVDLNPNLVGIVAVESYAAARGLEPPPPHRPKPQSERRLRGGHICLEPGSMDWTLWIHALAARRPGGLRSLILDALTRYAGDAGFLDPPPGSGHRRPKQRSPG